MVQLHYDKDETKLIAKKGKSINIVKSRPTKNNVAYSKTVKSGKTTAYSNAKNANHIVTKITGGATDKPRMKGHFEYITRNGDIPLFNENGEQVGLRDTINDTDNEMETTPYKANAKKTYQIVFSRKGNTDPETLKKVVLETMQSEFPNTKFYYACHQDTANTHVHVVLLRHNKDKIKHEIKKEKLNFIKKKYAEVLNKNGIKAVFLSETDKKKQRGEQVEKPKRENKRKGANEYIVLDFDKANYNFEENGKPSYYLMLQTKNNEKKLHWSWGLQAEIKNKGVKIGDKITLKKVQNLDTGKVEDTGKFKRSDWSIEIVEQSQGLSMQEFKLTDFGKAPYKFDEVGKPSYYVILEDHKGRKKDYWGKDFEQMIAQNQLKIGDKVIRNSDNPKELIKAQESINNTLEQQATAKQQSSGFKI